MGIDPVQESLFNVRAAVPDHMEIFADWRRRSDGYAAECPEARLDLRYGIGPAETLDFFPARNGTSPSPLILLIHGGYWQAMDKADNRFAARALNAAGFAVAVVNYTLCPATALGGIVDEMRRATLWIRRNADDLSVDPSRFYAIGHSAGGHLAAMLMCTDWKALDPSGPANPYTGFVAISGLFDLEPLVETTINVKVGLSFAEARNLSPIHHVPNTTVPFVAAVGGEESEGFFRQAGALKDAWSRYAVSVQCMTLEGCHHFQAFDALEDSNSELFRVVLSLVLSD